MHKQTYIKINRAYFDSPFWNENRPRTKAEAYIDLFQMATVSVNKYTTPDFRTTINLTRGEGVWSIRFLAKRWKWSRGKVESFFKILKVRKKARQELRQGIMVTFITEYSVSQGSDIYKKDTKQDGVKTGSRRGQDKYNNDKNVNNVKNDKKRTIPAKAENAGTKQFIIWWYEKFSIVFNEKYNVQGAKDGSLIKRLLNKYSYQELIELAERFFDSKDKFIQDSGYTIGVFNSQINKLLIKQNPLTETEKVEQMLKRRENGS